MSFPRLVVFDLDDTLFPERDYVRSGFAAVDGAVRRRFHRHGFNEAVRELFESGVRGRIFDEALVRLGLSPARPTVETLVEIYRGHSPAIALFDDVPRALDMLGGRARMAIISDGPLPSQRRKVAALRLGRRFDPIVLTDVWGRTFWKPHERAFRAVEAATGCAGSDCVYVGDNPAKDFLAPRALGWRTIRVRRPGCEHSEVEAEGAADVECSNLDELESILATEAHVEAVR